MWTGRGKALSELYKGFGEDQRVVADGKPRRG